jgi:RecA-family ATPase
VSQDKWTAELVGLPAFKRNHQNYDELVEFAEGTPEPESLLGPFKRGQVGFIAAPPGVGKSMLAMSILGAICQGRDFGPWEAAQAKHGYLLDCELTPRDLVSRLKVLDCDHTVMRVDHYDFRASMDTDAFSLGDPDHQAYIRWACKLTDVIVIDNVTFCLDPAPGSNLYAPETINQLRPLFNWIKATGKLLILVDHTNAEGHLSGSLNKQRLADWVIKLEADTRMDTMELAFTLKWAKYRGQGRPKRDTAFSMDVLGKWTHNEIIPLAEQVLEMLQQGAKQKEIADELGCSHDYVRKISSQRGGRR